MQNISKPDSYQNCSARGKLFKTELTPTSNSFSGIQGDTNSIKRMALYHWLPCFLIRQNNICLEEMFKE